jgi:hypothetical protein
VSISPLAGPIVPSNPVPTPPGATAWPGGIVLFEQGTPANLPLVTDALGDYGTAADGFDAAYAAAAAVVATQDTANNTGDVMLVSLAQAEADWEALPDEVSALLAAQTAVYDADEAALQSAILAMGQAPLPPFPASMPPLPGLPSLSIPQPVDVNALIQSLAVQAPTGGGISLLPTLIGAIIANPTGAVATGIAGLLGLVGAGAATGVGLIIIAGIALISLLIHFIGGGCGQACIESSEGEQIYEVAADDIWAVANQLGMISQSDYAGYMQAIIAAGTAHMQQLAQGGDNQANQGLVNMTNVINAEAALGASLPATAPNALDLATAQTVFLEVTAPGWYSTSVAAGNQLALSLLTATPAGISQAVNYLMAQG